MRLHTEVPNRTSQEHQPSLANQPLPASKYHDDCVRDKTSHSPWRQTAQRMWWTHWKKTKMSTLEQLKGKLSLSEVNTVCLCALMTQVFIGKQLRSLHSANIKLEIHWQARQRAFFCATTDNDHCAHTERTCESQSFCIQLYKGTSTILSIKMRTRAKMIRSKLVPSN